MMVLHFRLLHVPLRTPKIAKGGAEGNPYVGALGHLGGVPGNGPGNGAERSPAPTPQEANWASAGRAMM